MLVLISAATSHSSVCCTLLALHCTDRDKQTDGEYVTPLQVVPFVGAQIGLIVAETWAQVQIAFNLVPSWRAHCLMVQARLAAKKVVQTYGSTATPVLSVEQAAQLGHQVDAKQAVEGLMHPMIMGKLRSNPAALLHCSDADWSCSSCTFVNKAAQQKCEMCESAQPSDAVTHAENSVTATFKTGAQQHMPLETNSVCVVPVEADQYELHVGGQWPDLQQAAVSLVLNVKRSQINAKNSRVGGGFGGKILWQLPTCCAVAVAAHKLKRPVRLQSERSDNMQMTGD